MKVKAVSGIMLTLLLIGMLTLVFSIRPVKSDDTWAGTAFIYIRSNGLVDPPTAPIQRDGSIYTFTDNISRSFYGIGGAIVVERDNIVVDGAGYTLQRTGGGCAYGIVLSERSNITIKNMEIVAFDYGIYLEFSSNNNVIFGNKIINAGVGIWLMYGNNNNSIIGNKVTNNRLGIAIVQHSNNNSVYGNDITKNREYGIIITVFSEKNRILGNNITNNEGGICVEDAPARISGNNIMNNEIGVSLFSVEKNYLYHNNFVDNAQQVDWRIRYQSINTWDDGYPSGGNYWSDYNGTDLYGGLYQNETGSDGIGDTPYTIGENHTDNYPLMGQFQDFSVDYEEETYHVTTISNSTISAFQFDEVNKKISFNVTGLDETVGFCRAIVPTNLLKADATHVLKVFVDNIEINYTTAEKGNYTFIFFSYTHSTQKAQIILEKLPTPFWMQWWFWAIVATGIALAGTVYLFSKKKKPPTSTAPPLPSEGTETSIE